MPDPPTIRPARTARLHARGRVWGRWARMLAPFRHRPAPDNMRRHSARQVAPDRDTFPLTHAQPWSRAQPWRFGTTHGPGRGPHGRWVAAASLTSLSDLATPSLGLGPSHQPFHSQPAVTAPSLDPQFRFAKTASWLCHPPLPELCQSRMCNSRSGAPGDSGSIAWQRDGSVWAVPGRWVHWGHALSCSLRTSTEPRQQRGQPMAFCHTCCPPRGGNARCWGGGRRCWMRNAREYHLSSLYSWLRSRPAERRAWSQASRTYQSSTATTRDCSNLKTGPV